MMAMLRGQRLPPMPHLLSVLIQPKAPREVPEDEKGILSGRAIARLATPAARQKARAGRREFVRERAAQALTAGVGDPMMPAPEPALQPTFDPEVASHRYAHLESHTSWVARPQVEATAMDHGDGIEGVVMEKHGMLRPPGAALGGLPCLAWAQVHKDKASMSFQSQAEVSVHHAGRGGGGGGGSGGRPSSNTQLIEYI
jgi:hypothetical protein